LITQPVQTVEASADLSRTFGPYSLTLFGVGTVVGAGIFVLTGQAAALYAGPAVMLSFLVAGVVCALTALCYAELTAMTPVAGAAYSFTRYTFGQIPRWIVGWALVAEMLFAAGAVAIGWSAYVQGAVADWGWHLPAALSGAPWSMDGRQIHATGAIFNLPAALLASVMAALLYKGTKESARFNAFIVSVKLSAVVLFIVVGLAYAHTSNWVPFIPDPVVSADGTKAFGIRGIMRAAGIVFFAFPGFDAVATAAQETRRPERNVPIGILASLGISTGLYIAVSLAMTGMVDFHQLNTAAPLTVALAAAGPVLAWLKSYVAIAAAIGLGSAVLVAQFALSRLLFSLARDGLLSSVLSSVHRASGVPRIAVITGGVLAIAMAGLMPINLLGELVSTGTLLAFATVCAATYVLRKREPARARPFMVPLWPVTTILGVLSCLFLLLSMGWPAILRALAWQVIGAVIFVLGRRTASSISTVASGRS
jgi:basic amino acid/polyamine antiporter, APA family